MTNPDDKFNSIFGKIKIARKAITDKHGKDRGIRDSIECPICKSGKLQYSIASSNGHIHARCDSGKCVSWME